MFTLTISMTGAAFDPETGDPQEELCRLLRGVAGHIEHGNFGYEEHANGVLLDVNGNRVGGWIITRDTRT